jgi:RND family efflux transporter MFP subunit
MKKPSLKWIVFALVLVLVVGVTLRLLNTRKAKQESLDAQQTAQKVQVTLELGTQDVVQLRTLDMSRTLAISGPLKAVNSAFVKARVAGELQELTVREGDFVKAGQVIARVDSTDSQARVRQAQQQAESAKGQVDIAQRSFDNNRSLVDQGFISKTALDSSLATLASAQANYRAAQAGADIATKALEDTVLRAPIAGQISQRLAQAGERVAVDARIVEIVDLSRLELEAALSATDSLDVKVGQTAMLTIEGGTQPLQAKVVRINPSAVAGSRAVLAYLAIAPQSGLRQGLFAQGTLSLGKVRTLALPSSAVRNDKPQPYVQWISNGVVQHQTVEVGEQGQADNATDSEPLVAVRGVSEGATVLAGAVGTLREGTPVTIKTTSK